MCYIFLLSHIINRFLYKSRTDGPSFTNWLNVTNSESQYLGNHIEFFMESVAKGVPLDNLKKHKTNSFFSASCWELFKKMPDRLGQHDLSPLQILIWIELKHVPIIYQ